MKILVADDDPITRSMIEITLRKLRHEVVSAVNGTEALAEMESQTPPEMVFLDWMMPGMSGVEVCKTYKKRAKSLPIYIILVSSKVDNLEIIAAFEAGANNYLTKPIDTRKLKEKIEAGNQELDRWRRFNLSREADIQVTKMLSLGRMAGGMAHEINNPLTFVSASVSRIKSICEKNNVQAENLPTLFENIVDGVGRIKRVVKGLQIFSQDTRNAEAADYVVEDLINDALMFCRAKYEMDGVKIEVDQITKGLEISCQTIQIQQVLLTLLQNSYEAILGTGNLWIRIQVSEAEDWLDISVIDGGPGISDKIKDQIMEPFFTTREVGEGMGLGLSIADGIVKAHHGVLFLDSESENTKFTVRLPREQVGVIKQVI